MSETGTARKPIVATPQGKPNGRARRYRLERQLGAGSGAQVYLATALPDDGSADDTRPVALKISTVPKWKGWLAKEAELLRAITLGTKEAAAGETPLPDRIVKLTGDGSLLETPGRNGPDWLFELEYLDGQTLAEWIRTDWLSQPRTAAERLAVVVQTGIELSEALDQLACATHKPVIHRDLKPDNIMRTSRGLRVFDFNVGGALDEIRRTQVGTRGYMAPEIEAAEEHDQRADFYSVGVILFELFVGRRFEAWKDRPGPPMSCRFAMPNDWPSGLPGPVNDRLEALIGRLVCCASERMGSASALREELEAIEGDHTTATSLRLGPLRELDMIELLFELRPSGMASVVTDTAGRGGGSELQAELRRRMQVEDRLEDWLTSTIETLALTGGKEPRLVLLAGNAGDGKSHLIERLLKKLRAERPDLLDRLTYIADATHSHSPDEDQRGRLRTFFVPFTDAGEPDDRVRLIAMNTGMVINFFEKEQETLGALYRTLQWQLGLLRGPEPPAPGRVEVVNLDLRNMLVAAAEDGSFLDRMIDRLDPGREDSITTGHWSDCERCPAIGLCPVAFNLQALQRPTPRRGLRGLLQRVTLDAEVHLSPRSLWGFLYRMVTGGTERYVEGRRPAETPCDYVRRKANAVDGGAWLLKGQFTQSLFHQEGGGALFDGLIEHDPAYSSCPEIDRLHTRLSVRSELDCEPQYVEEHLGGRSGRLEGLQLADLASRLPREPALRRNAAVRREFFFSEATFEAWARTEGSESFVRLLRAYASWSNGSKPSQEDKVALQGLGSRIRAVFQRAHGRRFGGRPFLRVSQPNVRTDSELLVQATDDGLREMFALSKILLKDPHIVAHSRRKELLTRLGHQPVTVLLKIAGVQLIIDLELYDFLSRVEEGQKPAQRDLAQFQALLFVGERVGNQLATSGAGRPARLFVYGPEDQSLYELQTNDFGDVEMTRSPLQEGGSW